MASYSVATTKDHLSSLIDKALAGEEVVITRRGQATVKLVRATSSLRSDERLSEEALAVRRAAFERLAEWRATQPPIDANIPLHRFRAWLAEEEDV